MVRHHDDDQKRKNKESKDARLLRKAREYVEREEQRQEQAPQRIKSRGRNDQHDLSDDERHRSKRTRQHSSKQIEDDHYDDDDDRGKGRRRHNKRKHRYSEDEDTDDDRKKRKHKDKRKKRFSDEDDEDRRRRKKEKKKKSKHHSAARDDKKSKLNRIDKSNLYSLGDIVGKPPSHLLDPESDYFAYHQHLWVYLYREEGIAFGDLTSEESRQAFQRFCQNYNEGKLETAYYQAVLPLKVVEECKTTSHKWSFQTSATEVKSLHIIEEGVRKQTEYEATAINQSLASAGGLGTNRDVRPIILQEDPDDEKAAKDRLRERLANKRLREHVRTAEEEVMGGRKEGRERQIEKKKEAAAALHGAAWDREEAGAELPDTDLYGDGSSDFATALARQRNHREKRASEKERRLADLQQKERERQESMLKSLGLTGIKPGQKITIAPRKDL